MIKNINLLDISTSLVDIDQLFQREQAKAEITFWGSRVVKIQGSEDSIYLDDLASKVLTVSFSKRLTAQERVAGIDLSKKVNQWSDDTDKELKTWNCFTRFLCSIRETISSYLSGACLTPRDRLYGGYAESAFLSYPIKDFKREAQLTESDNIEEHEAFSKTFISNTETDEISILVKEDGLRELAKSLLRSEFDNLTRLYHSTIQKTKGCGDRAQSYIDAQFEELSKFVDKHPEFKDELPLKHKVRDDETNGIASSFSSLSRLK